MTQVCPQRSPFYLPLLTTFAKPWLTAMPEISGRLSLCGVVDCNAAIIPILDRMDRDIGRIRSDYVHNIGRIRSVPRSIGDRFEIAVVRCPGILSLNQIDRGFCGLRRISADFLRKIRLIVRQAHDKSAVSGLFRVLLAAKRELPFDSRAS